MIIFTPPGFASLFARFASVFLRRWVWFVAIIGSNGLEEAAHSNFEIATLFMNQALVAFRKVIAKVLESFQARTQRAGDTSVKRGKTLFLRGFPLKRLFAQPFIVVSQIRYRRPCEYGNE